MNKRLHYIDWLRILAFAILIIFHCAMPFVSFNWEVKDAETSIVLDRVIIWLHQWRLPLLFFISGVGVRFSLRKRSIPKFLGERFVRLLIPLTFAMFFITPLQVYIERLQKGEISMNYWEFFPSVFDMVPYPDGTLTWSHMWFVAYLFVFTLLLIPFFSLSKVPFFNKAKPFLNSVFRTPMVHLSLALPFIAYYFLWYVKWPEQQNLIQDWFNFNASITYYFIGYLVSGIPSFWEGCLRHRRLFLCIAVVMAVLLIWQYYWGVNLPEQQDQRLYLYGVLDSFHIWTIILASIGYTMRYLNFSSSLSTYLTSAVYPYYILHQTIIVYSGYYVTQLSISIWLKIVLLLIICIVGIAVLYHFIIRKTIITRVLFGVKWNLGRKKNS